MIECIEEEREKEENIEQKSNLEKEIDVHNRD